MKKKVLFIGQAYDASGYGQAFRKYLKCFDENNINFDVELGVISVSFEKKKYVSEEESELIKKYLVNDVIKYIKNNEKYECVYFLLPTTLEKRPDLQYILEKSEKNYSMVVWETDTVPKPWMDVYRKKIFSEIIVPCDWNKKVFEEQTGLKTSKLPYPLFLEEKPDVGKNPEVFRIFSMSQWIYRKGFDLLIKAYCSEFFYNTDTILEIKTYRATTASENEEQEKQVVINDAKFYKNCVYNYQDLPKCKIELNIGVLDRKEVLELYRKADVFCLPTRGEGFGLTIVDALENDLPIIVPTIGGHLDYINKFYPIESEMFSCFNSQTHYSSVDMKIVEPKIDSIRKQLRIAYNDWKMGTLNKNVQQNKEFCRNYLNSKKIYESFLEII